jgi:hypothetical protein
VRATPGKARTGRCGRGVGLELESGSGAGAGTGMTGGSHLSVAARAGERIWAGEDALGWLVSVF